MRHPTPAELHRMFQARVWREYAMAWDGRKTMTGVGREWVEKVLRVPRAECLQRARAALTANAKFCGGPLAGSNNQGGPGPSEATEGYAA